MISTQSVSVYKQPHPMIDNILKSNTNLFHRETKQNVSAKFDIQYYTIYTKEINQSNCCYNVCLCIYFACVTPQKMYDSRAERQINSCQ